MKNLFIVSCFMLVSCVSVKTVIEKKQSEYLAGKEVPDAKFVVIKRDGTKIFPKEIKFPKIVYNIYHQYLLADGQKILYDSMVGFQTSEINFGVNSFAEGYYIITRDSKGRSFSELPRMRHGKLDLYVGHVVDNTIWYYCSKNNEPPKRVIYEVISNAIADNSEAVSLLQTLFPKKDKIGSETMGQAYDDNSSERVRLAKIVELYNK